MIDDEWRRFGKEIDKRAFRLWLVSVVIGISIIVLIGLLFMTGVVK